MFFLAFGITTFINSKKTGAGTISSSKSIKLEHSENIGLVRLWQQDIPQQPKKRQFGLWQQSTLNSKIIFIFTGKLSLFYLLIVLYEVCNLMK